VGRPFPSWQRLHSKRRNSSALKPAAAEKELTLSKLKTRRARGRIGRIGRSHTASPPPDLVNRWGLLLSETPMQHAHLNVIDGRQ
jgi:hypothetical protein